MTSDEAKEALRLRLPIIYDVVMLGDVEYERITGICLREYRKRLRFELELKDKNHNSITNAPMERCRVKINEQKNTNSL